MRPKRLVILALFALCLMILVKPATVPAADDSTKAGGQAKDPGIPKNFTECFEQLEEMLTDEQLEKFMESDPIRYHLTLGMWIRNNWGLWSNSELAVYVAGRGGTFDFDWSSPSAIPDRMSRLILELFHIHLHNPDLTEEELIRLKSDYWQRPLFTIQFDESGQEADIRMNLPENEAVEVIKK